MDTCLWWRVNSVERKKTVEKFLLDTRTWLGVALGVQHDLRGAIPAGRDILRQEAPVVVLRVGDTGQTEIAYLCEKKTPGGTQLVNNGRKKISKKISKKNFKKKIQKIFFKRTFLEKNYWKKNFRKNFFRKTNFWKKCFRRSERFLITQTKT